MSQPTEQAPGAGCRLVRLAETDRPVVTIFHGGQALSALDGDTLLTALLCNGVALRRNEFDGGPRAGFCNMGACQDCWVVLEGGGRIRACTTEVRDGMRVRAPDEDA
ncbi:MAG: (2Fe-2S)-binding protein [Rhodospirillales bacterium]|nr:(2Fe-2S)-binding protein [Rhodospirillales bacterium]MDE0381101.1 (2Fe-2S)-binding protein [Rhodospirillales bacterium]